MLGTYVEKDIFKIMDNNVRKVVLKSRDKSIVLLIKKQEYMDPILSLFQS